MRYQLFPHTADLGVLIYGASVAELFSHAAFAVFDLMTELRLVAPKREMTIQAEGLSWEDLLVNYLREILYLYQGRGFLACDFSRVTLEETMVTAQFRGEMFDSRRHRMFREIKAVTYHQLAVGLSPSGWEARVLFDV